MSLAILHSRAQVGTDAPPVTAEVFLSGGLPSFSVVGMAETAVRESKDRVRSALLSSGFRFPQERITVSLAPADMRKSGGRFDLAIALGILAASRQVPVQSLTKLEFYGELALNGDLRSVPAILPAALKASAHGNGMIVPTANAGEAALAKASVRAADTLLQVTAHLTGNLQQGIGGAYAGFRERCFAGIRRRHDHAIAASTRFECRGQYSRHAPEITVQRKLAVELEIGQRLHGHLSARGEDAERNGEIEAPARLAHVGRRETDRNAFLRKPEAGTE